MLGMLHSVLSVILETSELRAYVRTYGIYPNLGHMSELWPELRAYSCWFMYKAHQLVTSIRRLQEIQIKFKVAKFIVRRKKILGFFKCLRILR